MTPTTSTKLANIFAAIIIAKIDYWKELLLSGNLSDFEKELHSLLLELYGEIMKELLNEVGRSSALKARLQALGASLGMSGLKLRSARVQIGTGQWIEYSSYYARRAAAGSSNTSRHLSGLYWGIANRATPKYLSLVSMMSIVCPSFELAKQVLDELGIQSKYKRIRCLSAYVGALGMRLGISAQLDSKESLSGKRVVVLIDGGRSRIRESTGKVSSKGYQKYDTPWREPKLIVVHVLDEKGQIDRAGQKPLYQASIQDGKACMDELVQILLSLNAREASEIQFLSDGASFIWKRIRNAFRKAGVPAKKITYTLDYYHAVEHLKSLSELLPLTKQECAAQFEEWKTWLWEGLANSIVRDFKKLIRKAGAKLTDAMNTTLNYFIKHHDRMQYKRFKRDKLLCGSGLVESAIRRVINLRFKGPSTFWCQENLDKMLLLRCALLAGRWINLLKAIELDVKSGGTV